MVIHGAAHGFVAGKSIFTNASEHTNSSLIVGVVERFLSNVAFPRSEACSVPGYSLGVATLLAAICTEASRRVSLMERRTTLLSGPRVLPQGSPASPALTNALGLRLDRRLSHYAESNGWRYTRC